jgi:isochorismate synthase EntC
LNFPLDDAAYLDKHEESWLVAITVERSSAHSLNIQGITAHLTPSAMRRVANIKPDLAGRLQKTTFYSLYLWRDQTKEKERIHNYIPAHALSNDTIESCERVWVIVGKPKYEILDIFHTNSQATAWSDSVTSAMCSIDHTLLTDIPLASSLSTSVALEGEIEVSNTVQPSPSS